MKRGKKLLILCGVLVALIGGIVAALLIEKHVDSINTVDEVVLSVNEDDLTALSLSGEDGDLSFARADETWTNADDKDFPIDQEKMSEFLENFEEVHASFIIDDVKDYDQYGLDDPIYTVTFTTSDGDTTLKIGDYSQMDEKRYIEVGDGKVYLVDTDPAEAISVNKDDYMDNDELPSIVTLKEFKVSGENALDIIYSLDGDYTYTDDYNYYVVDGDDYKPASNTLSENLVENITTIDLTDYATYTASSEDLSQYGLDNPALTIEVSGSKLAPEAEEELEAEAEAASSEASETADETTEDEYSYETDATETTAETTEVPEDAETEDFSYTVYIGVTEPGTGDNATETAYLRVGDSEIIYKIDGTIYDTLKNANYDSIRPAEVLSLDWSKVNTITATIDSMDYVINVDRDGDDLKCTYGDKEIDITDLKTAISALTMKEFKTDEPSKKLEMSLTIAQTSTNYPTMKVDIYQYDSDCCLVVVNDETVGLMERTYMVNLKEAVTSISLSE